MDRPKFSTYLIGSLRNPGVSLVAELIRETGIEVFDDWFAAGPRADDEWHAYERRRGHSYIEALEGHAATHVFEFDLGHLKRCDSAVLVTPAGKSGHLELGWMLGQGKPGWILVQDTSRWDVMYKFATKVFTNVDELVAHLREYAHNPLAAQWRDTVSMRPGPTLGVIDLTRVQDHRAEKDGQRRCPGCGTVIHDRCRQCALSHAGCRK